MGQKRPKRNQKPAGPHLSPAALSEVQKIVSANLRNTIETKVTLVSGDAVSVTATGTVVSATTNLVRGDTYNTLTGNLLKPTQWICRFTWSTAQSFSTVRALFFQWKDSTTPTASGLLEYTGDARAPHSPLLWTNIHKIHVLKDVVVALKPRVASGYDAKYFEVTMPGMAQLQFAGSSMALQMNGLYILLITDDIIGTAPQFTYASELRFTDA